MRESKTINKILAIYQILGSIAAFIFSLRSSITPVIILYLLFTIFTFIASVRLISSNEKKLFIFGQLIQLLGISVNNFVFYFHGGFYFGPSIGTMDGETVSNFYFARPNYLLLLIENRHGFSFSFNLIPLAIIAYFYSSNKKQKESDIIY